MNRLLHKYVLMYMKMLLDLFFCKMDRLLTFIFLFLYTNNPISLLLNVVTKSGSSKAKSFRGLASS